MIKKIKYIIATVGIIFFLWIILSTLEIGFHNTDDNYHYSKLNCFEILAKHEKLEIVTVISCKREMNYYIVTVKDSKGNLYEYYDGDYKPNGTELTFTYIIQ